jgi:hypothetical protein
LHYEIRTELDVEYRSGVFNQVVRIKNVGELALPRQISQLNRNAGRICGRLLKFLCGRPTHIISPARLIMLRRKSKPLFFDGGPYVSKKDEQDADKDD